MESVLHQNVTAIEGWRVDFTHLEHFYIEWAFDNTTFESMCSYLINCGGGPLLVRWVHAMLTLKSIHADLGSPWILK